ncbi:DUF4231 domain-containing protein [Streptomyces sp. V4-01]|uniref:DUF4231 domain-containing protein n=1 Tax=Actinacidiphila polyblastidii TaxID=3110430 RepID=A0ABU7P9U0_9ACTN|nr:DUF4231 domain-containing protein [Streptomyces sp. V4-01]
MAGPDDGGRRSAVFGDADLPGLFRFADGAAVRRQRLTVDWVRRQLVLLVVAAAFAAVPWRLRSGHLELLALVSAVAYVGALWFTWQTARHHHRENWQLHRSAAELLRSQCWRYAVCGAPFAREAPDAEGDFEVRVNDSLHELRSVGWRDPRPAGSSAMERALITATMRDLRGKPLAVRRDVYVRDRVMEQRDWYRRRTSQSRRAGAVWRSVAVLGTAAALAAAAARSFGWGASVDLVGLASSAAAASVAWSELRQYQPLVAAHSVVAQELDTMVVTMEKITTEAAWSTAVRAAEDAISPDHTAWLARHRT